MVIDGSPVLRSIGEFLLLIDNTLIILKYNGDGSCVPAVLSVATLGESGKAERQATRGRALSVLFKP